MVDFNALSRVTVEFISELPPKHFSVLATARATIRRAGRGAARGPKGTFIDCDLVAYLPPETNTRGAAFVRIEGKFYSIAFVDTDFKEERPVRIGLCDIGE